MQISLWKRFSYSVSLTTFVAVAATAYASGPDVRTVRMRDDCDPATFNANPSLTGAIHCSIRCIKRSYRDCAARGFCSVDATPYSTARLRASDVQRQGNGAVLPELVDDRLADVSDVVEHVISEL